SESLLGDCFTSMTPFTPSGPCLGTAMQAAKRGECDMQTILNPFGRIGPVTFRNMAIMLIAIGAMFSLMPLIRPGLALLSFASLLLVYPWVVIWVKRFHDAGKSGKLFLAVLAAWLVTGIAVNRLIVARFVSAPPPD